MKYLDDLIGLLLAVLSVSFSNRLRTQLYYLQSKDFILRGREVIIWTTTMLSTRNFRWEHCSALKTKVSSISLSMCMSPALLTTIIYLHRCIGRHLSSRPVWSRRCMFTVQSGNNLCSWCYEMHTMPQWLYCHIRQHQMRLLSCRDLLECASGWLLRELRCWKSFIG